MTCASCKHWDRSRYDYDFDGNELPYGRCASAESEGNTPKIGAIPTHPAYATDASGYHAALRTLPTFGCTEWKEKP